MRVRAVGRAREAGMTLLEIMIVLAIIGALMGFLIGPKLLKEYRLSQIKTTRILVTQYEGVLLEWRLHHPEADCPATLEELHAAELANARPIDSWDRPLVYRCPARDGKPWEVYSTGPDRVDGTDDDIRRAERVGP